SDICGFQKNISQMCPENLRIVILIISGNGNYSVAGFFINPLNGVTENVIINVYVFIYSLLFRTC
ncbi:MAG: hypothetical protein J5864_05580, partial [Oscillospiraceae bacterium]|nr:hypothetical protein [Oscillospiraceae bacterium]